VTDYPLAGGCGCGAVRFELTKPPVSALYCHCTRCQRRTGTASSTQARVEVGSVRIVEGADLLRAWEPEGGMGKTFCSACGSSLFATTPGDPTEVRGVRLGALDGDHGIRPQFRQFVDYAAPWEPIPDDGLPRHPERHV
jgi:hypothetical protein